MKTRHHNAVKEECPQGHAYDEENTYHYKGRRYCRVCKRRASYEARRK